MAENEENEEKKDKPKWYSAIFTTEGGIPTASASGYGFSVKASAGISVSASFINCNLTAGLVTLTGASFALTGASAAFTGASFAGVGHNAAANASKLQMEGLVNNLIGVNSDIDMLANCFAAVDNYAGALANRVTTLELAV